MLQDDDCLWGRIARGGDLRDRYLWGADRSVALSELGGRSSLGCPRHDLAGSAVLLATSDQLAAAVAAIELDGIVRRLVLCPPDLSGEHIPLIVEAADIDALVSDGRVASPAIPDHVRHVVCNLSLAPSHSTPGNPGWGEQCRTEWILLTSGTTGLPKMVVHTLSSLAGAIKPNGATSTARPVWSTFYDIRRYGGLQMFLRAALGGGSLVLSSAREATADFLARAGGHGVTHISGTPSHWRRVLMSRIANRIEPRYVRLSGEIADQAILDDLHAFYPDARVGHAFASTEAGVAFEVNDGLAGFPARLIGDECSDVEMRIEDNSLRIRSSRTATRYLGDGAVFMRDEDGFVDTGDLLERQDDRYYFLGRRGGVINVGGLKVYPEEVEAVINRHPAVQMSLVKAQRNPFTGAIVVAEVVVRQDWTSGAAGEPVPALENDIIAICRRTLPSHKVPAVIRSVSSLSVGATGKLARPSA
jgi:acyl-CoA synthetase (AMP-forming)/AMP-acid ligase II